MSIKRDKRKKADKKKQNNLKNNRVKELDQFDIQQSLKKLINPSKLTTPHSINDDIKIFSKQISCFEPIFINIEPELWSRQDCCNLNVKEYIKMENGKIVCGYKLWYNEPNYIEAIRHAVWFKDGVYKDITFNSDGENKILFIPDVIEKQDLFEINKSKLRWGKNLKTRELIKLINNSESKKLILQANEKESWDKMITYEQWLNGQRMDSMQSTRE